MVLDENSTGEEMNLTALLVRIRNMKDREGLLEIVNAAEARSKAKIPENFPG